MKIIKLIINLIKNSKRKGRFIKNMKVLKYETCKNKNLYFNEGKVKPKKYNSLMDREIVNIYPDVEFQEFYGFGGAMTEAAAYLYSLLPEDKKKAFLEDYFSKINYSLCRISVGSCDFSLSSYSYAKKRDLSDFSIEKDMKYIIPFLQDAKKVNPNLKFLASPWSPPKFMKTNKMLYLGGKLAEKYKQIYADYLVKFIDSYKKLGIDIDFMTVQNETNAMPIWESCLYNADDEVDFVANYLYPTFKKNNISTKIIVYDHNKEKLFKRACDEFNKAESKDSISGIAFHWYSGNHFENISLVRQMYPDKLLFHTEGCFSFDKNNDFEGQYAHDIIEDLNAGINGYIDWNILLDNKGGPNHKHNYCNSISRLTEDNNDYTKSLAYYYVGHFSKFIQPGSKRIGFSKYLADIRMTAFKNPDGSIVIVMINDADYDINFHLCLKDMTFQDCLKKKSAVTYKIVNE